MSFCERLFSYIEYILFDFLDEPEKIENRSPFSENNTKTGINYDSSESDSSEDDSDIYHYIVPVNGYKITRRNVAFC